MKDNDEKSKSITFDAVRCIYRENDVRCTHTHTPGAGQCGSCEAPEDMRPAGPKGYQCVGGWVGVCVCVLGICDMEDPKSNHHVWWFHGMVFYFNTCVRYVDEYVRARVRA